ncbi:myelin protein zero-like protein 3 isoform X2 [Chrysemys picta bellii]|uniref:myelin protein zero-like protein 3 isoform X2 n=1 Tax=Chrysemys picta bellii TaxID=8478 RepID=UPI0032B26AB5
METAWAAILRLHARPFGQPNFRSGLTSALPCLPPGVCNALSLEIKVDPEVQAFVDEQVTLKCSFSSVSPITQKLTVDWSYQPLTGGRTETIFHYQSVAYPAVVGTFRDRISWVGNVAKGDASIAIQNLTMNDNGTFTCAVKNPPDVHHNIPQTKLTVTHRGLSPRSRAPAWGGWAHGVCSVWTRMRRNRTDGRPKLQKKGECAVLKIPSRRPLGPLDTQWLLARWEKNSEMGESTFIQP